jgi:CBS domain containing-hemolysin-like protein
MDVDSISFFLAPIPPGDDLGAGSLTGLIIYVLVALGVSFLCSVLEAVLLSVSVSHVKVLNEMGSRAGRLMQKHKANIERPISAILTLNTIAHTVGAAGAGAEAAAIFGNQFIGVISMVLTFLILVFSEIIPKTLGAVYWRQLTPFTAYVIEWMVIALLPVVWLFEKITRKMRPSHVVPSVTRLDMEIMASVSMQEGVLLERENRVLRNLLRLQDFRVSTIMTPRTVLMSLQQDQRVGQVLEQIRSFPYSRILIYEHDLDDTSMYVLRSDIFELAVRGEQEKPLKEIGRSLKAIPESKPVAKVMEDFIEYKEHIFLVVDEYGETEGIVTMEDVMESLLGIEITDETDLVVDLRQLALERYQRKLAGQ